MTTYKGRVDCYMNPASDGTSVLSRLASEVFVNLFQFLSESSDLGIELIAANYGINGTGTNFWDEANPFNTRGWGVFRFHSASMGKFDMFLFHATGSTTTGGMNISTRTAANGSSQQLVGVSFGCHPSGSNTGSTDGPWNGTYSLTSASIGSPVWKLNSEQKGAFFPRPNGIGGNLSGSRNGMSALIDADSSAKTVNPLRLHMILTEESITISLDWNTLGYHQFHHFGAWTPRSGVVAESPYAHICGLRSDTAGQVPIASYTSVTWGTTTMAAGRDGGISIPTLLSGSKVLGMTMLETNANTAFNPHIDTGGGYGAYESSPIIVTPAETTFWGFMGTLNHLKATYAATVNSVSSTSSSAVFGSIGGSTYRVMVPWQGQAPNTYTTNRRGRDFTFTL